MSISTRPSAVSITRVGLRSMRCGLGGAAGRRTERKLDPFRREYAKVMMVVLRPRVRDAGSLVRDSFVPILRKHRLNAPALPDCRAR